jgi:hypothetical protein
MYPLPLHFFWIIKSILRSDLWKIGMGVCEGGRKDFVYRYYNKLCVLKLLLA